MSDTLSKVSPSATETVTLHENVFGCGGCGLTSSEPLTGHDCAASALGRDKPNEDESALLGALNVTSSYIESLPVAFAEGFQTILLSLAALREENASLRSPSSPAPRESRSEIKRRVTMQGGTMDEAFEEIKRVESSRGTEPEDFERLLEDFGKAYWRMTEEQFNGDSGYRDALAAIRGYVSRLQSERDGFARIIAGQNENLVRNSNELSALRSQLSRIQQTGLTAEDVEWLRRMSFTTMDKVEAESHQGWWQSFLARIRPVASEMEEALIEHECGFSHLDWRYVDGLRATASALELAVEPSRSIPKNA